MKHIFNIVLIIVELMVTSCLPDRSVDQGLLFTAQQHDGYTEVTLLDPWERGTVRSRFLLVPHGEALPEGLPEGTIIRTPVHKAVVYTSLHASIIEQLGAIDCICGVCEPQYLTNEAVKAAVSEGRIANLGLSLSPDIEKIVEQEADLIIATPFQNSGYGTAEKIGIPIFEAADYMEQRPLDRASWVTLFGLLFDRQAQADSLLGATTRNYEALKELAASAQTRPTVLLERKYGSAWGIPAGESYIATMHKDAGANYIFSDVPGTNSVQYSFEEVLDRAIEADFWLLKHNTTPGPFTYGMLEEEYAPYNNFEAFKQQHIFGCNTVEVSYYDDIAIHPDWILADFIKIYHPELLPDYQLRYYQPLAR